MTENFASAKTWAERNMKTLDGRSIIGSWNLYYLGDAVIENQLIKAENKMKSLTYHMETMKYNFEKYTTVYGFCHNQINAVNAAMNLPLPPLP